MGNLFNGYLISNYKTPLSSVKNKENWLTSPPTDGRDYCGILNEDYIQLDFDKEEDANTMLKIIDEYKIKCDILKTSRGIHVYMLDDGSIKSQSVGVFNAIGISCDIGLGSKNRVIPLRTTKEISHIRIVNGEEVIYKTNEVTQREWLKTYTELEVIPAFLKPISKTDYNLEKSTSRNQTLFTYILKLQLYAFTREEIRKTIKVINKHILYEPLTDREIDTITRDESFSEELFFTEKGAFLHDRFGNYMLSNSHIVRIEGRVFIYTKNNLYSDNPAEFERQMISKIPSLKDTQRKEVYKYISLQCVKNGEFSSAKYMGLKSDILDLETMEQFPYAPNFIINNRIDYEYNENGYSKIMDETLNKVCCHDTQIRTLLEEMIGYSLYRANTMQSCFILTGEGSNGKSTILNCVKKLLGKSNYTSLDLRELEETFKPSELYNKLANIGDDISAKYLETSSVFKKVVTGESFMVQRKYADPFELESYATQIFCANELPQVHDKTDGFSRRIVIVPFNARFTKCDVDYDPFIEDKLMSDDAIEYLLKIAIAGLKRIIFNKGFTSSTKGETEKADYIKSNNNIIEWLEDEPTVEHESVNDVFLMYQVWCVKTGCQSVKKLNFSKEVKRKLGLVSKPKTIDGKTIRVYGKDVE
jgi:putative DNA primase/helicase